MRKIIIGLSLICSFISFSQNVHVKIEIETNGISCNLDTIHKQLVLEKKNNETFQRLYDVTTTKCYNEYEFPKLIGDFRLIIRAESYKEQVVTFKISSDSDEINLGKVILYDNAIVLDEVTIAGNKRQYIKIEADKTTYVVKGNPLLSTGMVADAIKKIPGVLVSPSGNLAMNGKDTVVYIDGIPSSLTGQDLTNYIQSLPASTVEKIELIANPGASFEANTSGGIINVITYGKSLTGLNGTLNLHYGINHNNKPAPSIVLNGRVKTINWQLQTGYNYLEGDSFTKTDKTFTSFSPQVLFFQSSKSISINRNFYLRPMVNIKLSKQSNLIFNYNLNVSNNSSITYSKSSTENFSPSISLNNDATFINRNNNNEIIAKYKTKLDTLGKSLQITTYYSMFNRNNNSNSIQENNSIKTYSINDINLDLNNFYLKYDFELPIEKLNFTINTGGKFNVLNSSSYGKYNLDNISESIFDNPLYLEYLDFKYKEINYSFYAEAKKKYGKLNITAGLRMEDLKYKSSVFETATKVDKHLNNFFPTIHFLYEFNNNLNIVSSYTRKISLPPYSQLDPNNSGYYDQYNSNVGNQFLQPNFYNNYSFKISAFNWLQIGADYSFSKDISLMSFSTPSNSLNTVQSFKTYDAIKYFSVFASIPVPFGLISKGKSFFNQPIDLDKMSGLLLYASYNNHKVEDYSYVNGQNPFWQFYVQSQIIMPYKFKISMDYGLMTKGTYQIYSIEKPIQMLNVNISRKFLNNKLEASIHVLDVYKSFEINGKIPSQNLEVNYFNNYDSRVFWLKLTYNFGKLKSKTETEINSEKKQIDGGGLNNIGK